jgi:hypothetical protein
LGSILSGPERFLGPPPPPAFPPRHFEKPALPSIIDTIADLVCRLRIRAYGFVLPPTLYSSIPEEPQDFQRLPDVRAPMTINPRAGLGDAGLRAEQEEGQGAAPLTGPRRMLSRIPISDLVPGKPLTVTGLKSDVSHCRSSRVQHFVLVNTKCCSHHRVYIALVRIALGLGYRSTPMHPVSAASSIWVM